MTLIDIDSGTQVVDDNDDNSCDTNCDGSLTRRKRHSFRIGAKNIGIIITEPTVTSSTVSSPPSLLDNGGRSLLDCDRTCSSSSNSSMEESDDDRDDEGKKKKRGGTSTTESKNANGNKQKNKTVIVGGHTISDTRFPAEDFILNSSNSLLPAINEKKKNTTVSSQRSTSGQRSVVSHNSSTSSSSATDFVSIYDGSVDDEDEASYQTTSSASTLNSFYKMIVGGYPSKTKSFIDDLLGDEEDHNDRKKSLKKKKSTTSIKSITIDTISRGDKNNSKDDIYYEDGGTVNTQSFTSMSDDPIELMAKSSSSKRIINRKIITKRDWFTYLSCCIIILLMIVTIVLFGLYTESKDASNLNTSNTATNTNTSTPPQSDVNTQTPPNNNTTTTTTKEIDDRTTTNERNGTNNSTINSNGENGTVTNNNTNSSSNDNNDTNDEEEKNATQIFMEALMNAMNKSKTDPPIQMTTIETISSIYINAGGDQPIFDPTSNTTWYPDSNYLRIDPPKQNDIDSNDQSLTTVYGNFTPYHYRNDISCPDQVKMNDLVLSLSSLLNGSINQTVATELLCTERWFNQIEGTLRYTIPVPMNGHYQVILYFTELWFPNPKERVFDIYIQSVQYKLTNFDINLNEQQNNENVDSTSSSYNPIVQVIAPNIWVTDGYITLDFIPKVSNPKINAIVIHPLLSTSV